MRFRIIVLTCALSLLGASVATAYVLVVTDPWTTVKNAAIAELKRQIVDVLTNQATSLRRMARRLSLFTDVKKYVVPDAPRWRTRRLDAPLAATEAFMQALNAGDYRGVGYEAATNTRVTPGAELSALAEAAPAAYAALRSALATLDVADSIIMTGTDQTGRIRGNRRGELSALTVLEEHFLDPTAGMGATAVLEKISGAGLIRAGQQDSRLQFVTAIVQQLLLENKRARDTEAAAMNMQLKRLEDGRSAAASLVAGAGDDIRTWRQP